MGPLPKYIVLVWGYNCLPGWERRAEEAHRAKLKIVVRTGFSPIVRIASLIAERTSHTDQWDGSAISRQLTEAASLQMPVDLFVDCRIERRCGELDFDRTHSGVHPRVMLEIVRHPDFKNLWPILVRKLAEVNDARTGTDREHDPIVIAPFCREGKHRSAAMATVLASYGNNVQLRFMSKGSPGWCGAFCSVCGECMRTRTAQEEADLTDALMIASADPRILL